MIVTLLAAAALAAAPADAPRIERVSYADLDLKLPRDRRTLDKRLAGAIARLCGSYAEVKADDFDGITACRKVAKASVAPQIAALNSPDRVIALVMPAH